MSATALDRGEPLVGHTLDALAQLAREHRTSGPGERYPGSRWVDLAGYGHVVVSEPAEPDAVRGDDRAAEDRG